MQTFTMPMSLTKGTSQSGFTLLELMIVLLIVGVVLSFGAGILYTDTQKIDKYASKVLHVFSSARIDAIVSRSNITISFENNRIIVQSKNNKEIELFDNDISLYIVKLGEAGRSRKPHVIFGQNGICEEFLLLLRQNDQTISIYISPTGDNLLRHGEYSLEELRQELLTGSAAFEENTYCFA